MLKVALWARLGADKGRYSAIIVRVLVATTIGFVLQSCSIAVGKKFSGFEPIDDGQASIYVLRTEGGVAFKAIGADVTGSYPEITVNNRSIGLLKRGGYLIAHVVPGKVTVATVRGFNWSLAKQSVDLNVVGGGRYFIQMDTVYSPVASVTKPSNTRVVSVSFVQIDEKRASEILKELSLP